jgi:hypothetical protein
VYSELSSAREIIKLLQEEENYTHRASEQPRKLHQNLEVNQKWTNDLYTNWSNCKPGRKYARRNFGHPKQEVLPTHINRYNVLRILTEPQIVNSPTPHKTLTTFRKKSGNISKSVVRNIEIRGKSS